MFTAKIYLDHPIVRDLTLKVCPPEGETWLTEVAATQAALDILRDIVQPGYGATYDITNEAGEIVITNDLPG